MEEKETKKTVSKEMLLGEIVSKFPETAPIIQEAGLHCIGCGAAFHETLEQGCLGHGFSQEQIEELVKAINKKISESG